MSTTDRVPTQPADVPMGTGVQEGPAAGSLSPAELARIANEFFHALPDTVQQPALSAARVLLPPNSAFTGNPYAAVPGPAMPAVSGMPAEVTEASPQAILAVPDRSIAPELRPHPPATPYSGAAALNSADLSQTSSAIPGTAPSVGLNPTTDATAFAFLQEARPLFPSPVVPSVMEPKGAHPPEHMPQHAIPNDAVSEDVPRNDIHSNGESYAAVPASLRTGVHPFHPGDSRLPATPALPPAPGADRSPVPIFSFMEDARPLFSVPPSLPGPVPSLPAQNRSSHPAAPFSSPLERDAPQIFGAVAHAAGFGVPVPVEDHGQPRALPTGNVVPLLVPGAGQQERAKDLGLSSHSFDVEAVRRDFPILKEKVNGRPLIWFDNGATTQKPQSVIDRITYFYEHENSNVHRAAHELAARATDAYESAREKTRRFLNAGSTREIVFARGATEAINLVAQSWGRRNLQKDDEIVITWLEHHANIVPWQMLCTEKGARLRVAPVDDTGEVLLDEYEKLLGPKTRLVAITQVSNALGTIVPVKQLTEAAHRHGAQVLVDGAQAVSHMRVDVQSIGCDFYVFSGHKVFAPTGIGVLFGKSEVLEAMPPWQGGGNMIQDVTFEKTLYQPAPQRFEAGTGNIADAIGLGAAIDYLDRVGIVNVARHEHGLLAYATAELERIPGLRIVGTAKEKASVLSFVMEGLRTEEIGDYLNQKGIAVRGGHHCAQPILRRFGVESTLRATFALYNTFEEVDALVAALWDLRAGRSPGVA